GSFGLPFNLTLSLLPVRSFNIFPTSYANFIVVITPASCQNRNNDSNPDVNKPPNRRSKNDM
ncbi:hypothetical protein OFC03_29810, partial [Escherichia coli]|nr:hypothetical protein [Escherichia coli]